MHTAVGEEEERREDLATRVTRQGLLPQQERLPRSTDLEPELEPAEGETRSP